MATAEILGEAWRRAWRPARGAKPQLSLRLATTAYVEGDGCGGWGFCLEGWGRLGFDVCGWL